jgi:hypothetical protein
MANTQVPNTAHVLPRHCPCSSSANNKQNFLSFSLSLSLSPTTYSQPFIATPMGRDRFTDCRKFRKKYVVENKDFPGTNHSIVFRRWHALQSYSSAGVEVTRRFIIQRGQDVRQRGFWK